MLLSKLTLHRNLLVLFLLVSVSAIQAQENSPFARYGLGDLYPQQTIEGRAMGGLSAAYISAQSLNTYNPASYGSIDRVTFDVGITIDQRTLRSANPGETYSSANFLPSYITIGTPISVAKKIGFVIGFKPVTRINYNITDAERTGVDSLQTNYLGTGGMNQFYVGFGKAWGDLRKPEDHVAVNIGFNTGYDFGRKDISTIIDYVDTSITYSKSNFETVTSYYGLFFNPGAMIGFKLGEKTNKALKLKQDYILRFGASATFQTSLHATQNYIAESFDYDANGAIVPIDTIAMTTNVPGRIVVPSSYTAGFMLISALPTIGINKWSFGADYYAGNWNNYSFYGAPDNVSSNWTLHVGGELTPDPFSLNLFNRCTYRAGFYTGTDYMNPNGLQYRETGFTLGMGFFLRKFRTSYDNQSSLINTSFEFGKRGTSADNITEDFFKFSVGFSLSDLWYLKHKYD